MLKPKDLKEDVSEGDIEEGLHSLVNTTLHGDCRPVMEYGLVCCNVLYTMYMVHCVYYIEIWM